MVLAMNQGTPLDMASISRKTRLNPRTLKELLRYFESMFLLRTIPVEGGQRHPSLFLEDQGLASFLIGKPLTPYENLVRGLYANIRHEFHYRPELNSRYFQYRTRGGADIPLAWHTSHGTLGIAPCIESTATASAVKSAQSFTKNYPHAHVLILHSGTEYRKISDQIAMTPFESVL
jgi:predicted AAA+ superfamily ATPase